MRFTPPFQYGLAIPYVPRRLSSFVVIGFFGGLDRNGTREKRLRPGRRLWVLSEPKIFPSPTANSILLEGVMKICSLVNTFAILIKGTPSLGISAQLNRRVGSENVQMLVSRLPARIWLKAELPEAE